MKTTLYGNGKSTNEFGTPKEPKETNFVHPVYTCKVPIPISTMREMSEAFHRVAARYPTTLYIAGGSIGTKFTSFMVSGGAIVGLDIIYNAPETKVA
ncbi:MAG: hypothetical protein A3E01_00360 [Gammaproteobacteria bacterium RIFCSPHIGHO2_12_FULL_63_22]|nr:MAG: hypothetical protein A3E01_00360 [Gammaproteobacteria bacterium RIFCSPHIGHO2_12_FULL_63_22]